MLHPSYSDLIKVVNSGVEEGEQPVVQSRYSIVIATAKRARQLIAGADTLISGQEGKKPLSVAVDELYSGAVKILGEDEEEAMNEMSEEMQDGNADTGDSEIQTEDAEDISAEE